MLIVGRDISLHKQVEEGLQETKRWLQEQISVKDKELRRAQERLNELVVRGPSIVYSANPYDTYATTFMSENARSLLGYSPEDFTQDAGFWLDRIHPEDKTHVVHGIDELFERNHVVTEYRFLCADGFYHWMRDEERVIRDEKGTPVEVVGSWIDITEEKQARLALQQSEERYRTLTEAGRDLIFIVDRDDRFEYVNQNLANEFSLAPAKMVGMKIDQFFSASISEMQKLNQEKVFASGEAMLVEEENEFPGGKRWMSVWLVPIRNEAGDVASVMGVARDISNLKSAEAALRDANDFLERRVAERTADLETSHQNLRQLTQAIVHAQEAERRRVARELHDEAGQSLVGLKMTIDQVLSEIPESQPELRNKISKVIADLSQTMREIRSLAHGLRPSALDVAGINIALTGLCQEMAEQARLDIQYTGIDLPSLPDDISVTLYRLVQEALTNIVKHAKATIVWVNLEQKTDEIRLTVLDDGHGFNPATIQGSLGLQGMNERISLLGGMLKISSMPGEGTTLQAFIPYTTSPS
jgi:PAS domain S-box-containing protein